MNSTHAWAGPRRFGAYTVVAGGLALAMRVICTWEVHKEERLPAGPLIVAPNHLSVLDPLVVAFAVQAAGRTPRFVATAGMFEVPVIGRVLRYFDHLPLDRSAGDQRQLARISAAVAAGECVVMYPEGRVTDRSDHRPVRGLPGVAKIAAETGAPIVPLGQWGSQDLWLRGRSSLRRWPPRRARVRFAFGPAVHVEAGTDIRGCLVVMRRIMADIAMLADQARQGPTTPTMMEVACEASSSSS